MSGLAMLGQRTKVICVAPATREDPNETNSSRPDIEMTYRMRRPALIRFLVRLGLDSVEADDVSQEAFLRAIDSSEKGNAAPHNLFQWLLVAARNIALNRIRHQKYEILAPAELWMKWESKLLDPTETPDMDVVRRERYRVLIEEVSALSAIEQQCILLRFQEVPFQDIAAVLKIPIHSAVYYAGTGIQKLRRKLKNKIL